MSLKPLLLLSMSRILTGIQSTGTPHLGNILGAIIHAIEESKKNTESFLFIADLHSLTQIKNPDELSENTYSTAAAWLAFGLDTSKTVFYKQSDVPLTTIVAPGRPVPTSESTTVPVTVVCARPIPLIRIAAKNKINFFIFE